MLLAGLLVPETAEIAVPASLEGVLRKYQTAGYRWLKTLVSYRLGGILADDMGLGKTLQAIAVLLSVLETPLLPNLVAMPTSLLYNWQKELARFAPRLSVQVVAGSQAQRRILLKERAASHDVLLTTYGMLRKDIACYEGMTFRHCILDEAQQIKNAASDSARRQAHHRAGAVCADWNADGKQSG